jgi:hypothetical protein
MIAPGVGGGIMPMRSVIMPMGGFGYGFGPMMMFGGGGGILSLAFTARLSLPGGVNWFTELHGLKLY